MDDLLITLSESATSKIRAFQEEGDRQGMALRVAVREDGPAAFRYELQFVSAESRTLSDAALEVEGILIYVDEESVPNLKGTLLDYVDAVEGGGFAFDNPNQPPLLRDPVAARVHQLIQERINPGLASHGGRATLLDVRDGKVYLEFGGGCHGCGMVEVTLKRGVEATIKSEIPQITEVLDTTDHASGTNPYYQGT